MVASHGIKKSESKNIALLSGKLMMAQMNPFISREKYNKLLSELLDSLSEDVLRGYVPQIGDFLHLKKGDSRNYPGASRETEAILNKFPRLKPYKNRILKAVVEHRLKCKLTV